MPKRIMREFRLEEISAVDFPAQKGATMAIMKRASTCPHCGKAMEDCECDDYEKALTLEGGNNMPENEREVASLKKQVADLTTQLEAATTASEEVVAKAAMSDVEKEHYEALDDKAKKSFRAMSPADRKAAIVKAAEKDETLVIDGRTISKSKVGDDNFAVFKAQQAEIEKNRKEAAEERDRRQMAEFTKRADEDFKHLPGEAAAKALVLKAVSGMTEEVQKTFEAMLAAGEKAIKAAYDKLGHLPRKEGAGDPKAFEKRISEIASRDKCGRAEAMSKARKEYPEEFEAYQSQS